MSNPLPQLNSCEATAMAAITYKAANMMPVHDRLIFRLTLERSACCLLEICLPKTRKDLA